MNILLYNGQVWDSTWGHHKNLVEELSKEHRVYVIDLIDYGLRYASKLQGKTYSIPQNVQIVKRRSKIEAGVLLGLYTEFRNLWDFLKVECSRKRFSSDILITYLTSGVILTVLLAKCLRKKIVLMYADDYAEFFRGKSSLVGWFTEHIGTPLVAKCCDHIVTTAHKLREDLLRFNPNITVISNGVHLEKFRRDNNSQQPDSKNRPFTVGFVGGFGSWVDFDMVLAAAEALPDVQFTLIGSGDQFEDVRSRASSLNNVWIPGILPHDKLPHELAMMDVCLIPFKINRITDRVSPVKLFEYWAMKKPVISTRFYEIQKIAAGKVFFIDNADDLQQIIVRLREQPEILQEITQKGGQEVSFYDWAKLGERHREIIRSVSP